MRRTYATGLERGRAEMTDVLKFFITELRKVHQKTRLCSDTQYCYNDEHMWPCPTELVIQEVEKRSAE